MDHSGIDALMEQMRQAFEIPGLAIAVVTPDETYLQAYGTKELGKDDPVDVDTLFAVASVTKAFTTTAMSMLIDEGKMSWEDHPRKHVPGFKLNDWLADSNVTLRDLVCHRTGLARHDGLWYNSAWSSQEILEKIPHLPPTYSFRSTYQYNNLMYMVAGLAVESAAGMPWADFVKTRIFEPLGMSRSCTSITELPAAGNYCTAHEREEEKTVPFKWTNVDSVNACGSINSCVSDMAKWVKFQLGEGEWEGKRLLSKERLDETHSAQMVVPVDEQSREMSEATLASYCLGWNLLNHRDWTIVAHGGSLDGFNSGVVLVPKANLGVVVLSNLCSDNTMWATRLALVDHLLGLPPKNWIEMMHNYHKANREKTQKTKEERAAKRAQETQPSLSLEAYAGNYSSRGYGTTTIILEEDALWLAWNNHRAKLEHWHYDTFLGKYAAPDWPVEIEALFGLETDGSVGSIRVIWPNSSVEHTFRKAK